MTKTSNQIVFFGNEKLATGVPETKPIIKRALEKAGFEIEKTVTGPLTQLGNHKARLAVLAAYGRIVPQSVIDEFPVGIINVHPSLLPAYRGPTPIEQSILDGVAKTGVSIMKLTAGMDEGPIYKQKSMQLTGHESKIELTERLQKLGADLLVEILPSIAEGILKPRSQPHPNRATYSRKLTKQDGKINWHKPAQVIEREIRAFSGWPRSYTQINGLALAITKAKVVPLQGRPGQLKINKNSLVIYAGNDALEITQLQPASKKEMPVSAFIAGYRRQVEEQLAG